MFEIAGIAHIGLGNTKLSEKPDFYTKMMGGKVERETPEEVGLTQLRAGSALIDLITVDSQLGKPGGGPPGATENNVDHFCLQLRPIQQSEIESHLRSHGIQFGDFELRVGAQGLGSSVYIKDPEGNIVELRSQI